jgi:hypothetical protein
MTERIAGVRRRRWPEGVYRRAQSLLVNTPDLSHASVADALAEEFDPAPSEKTIGDWLAKGVIRRPDPSELWSVSTSDAETARLVLPVLAGVIEHTRGAVRRLTKAEAAWVAKLRHLSGELMPAWTCYLLATAYLHLAEHGLDTDLFDHYLAFANWKTWPLPNERYSRAIHEWGVQHVGFAESPAIPTEPQDATGEEGIE